MKPEYKAEYDALNLPLEFHVDECGSAHGWSYWCLLDQRGPADVLIKVNSVPLSEWEHEESHKRAVAEFIVKAAREYHALKSAVDDLRDELSRLQSVVGEEDYLIIEQSLKQTEGLV